MIMEKSKIPLILKVFAGVVVIFVIVFFIAPVLFVTAMTGGKNRVRDIDMGTSRAFIENFRASLLQESNAKASPETTSDNHIRLVNHPTFSGSFGEGYLCYTVPASARAAEIQLWQNVTEEETHPQNVTLRSIADRNDNPPWWPPIESDLVYVGVVRRPLTMPFQARDICVWVGKENSTFYAFFSFGH